MRSRNTYLLPMIIIILAFMTACIFKDLKTASPEVISVSEVSIGEHAWRILGLGLEGTGRVGIKMNKIGKFGNAWTVEFKLPSPVVPEADLQVEVDYSANTIVIILARQTGFDIPENSAESIAAAINDADSKDLFAARSVFAGQIASAGGPYSLIGGEDIKLILTWSEPVFNGDSESDFELDGEKATSASTIDRENTTTLQWYEVNLDPLEDGNQLAIFENALENSASLGNLEQILERIGPDNWETQ